MRNVKGTSVLFRVGKSLVEILIDLARDLMVDADSFPDRPIDRSRDALAKKSSTPFLAVFAGAEHPLTHTLSTHVGTVF